MTELLSMDQAFIRKLTDIVLANLANEDFSVEKLAAEAGMSHASIHRRLKAINNQDVSQFIREIRLQKAMELLRQNAATISEIAFMVGFGSPAYFIKCFHDRYGYPPGEARKREPVSPENVPANDPAAPAGPPHHSGSDKYLPPMRRQLNYRNIVIISGGFLAAVLLIFLIYYKEPAKSIVVLPLDDHSDNKEIQYIADGITEDIYNNLSRISELNVSSPKTAEQYLKTDMTAKEIARKMHINYVLEGSVQQIGKKVRVWIQLFDVLNDRQLLSERPQDFEMNDPDIFLMQSDIAILTAKRLEAAISPEESKQIKKIPTTNPEAYNFYLNGRFFINKRTKEGFEKSIEYFDKAVKADPEYALAWAGLADAYLLFTWYGGWHGWNDGYRRPEGYDSAKYYASQALKIDRNLAEAHTVLGALLYWHEWKWEEARKELKRAVELNPNLVTAHSYYAELLDILGENDEARRQINLALELDPFFPMMRIMSALFYYHEGKFSESLIESKKVMELNPGTPYWFILNYGISLRLGDDMLAVETAQNELLSDLLKRKDTSLVKDVYNKSGINGLLNWMNELELVKENPNPFFLATRYAMLGNKEETLKWIEKEFDERHPDLARINNNPDYDFIRSEPRFQAIIKKMGLSEYQKRK
jgi:TolB-like protein/AraC-like DNA-binding protein